MTTKDEFDEKVRGWFTGRLPEDWFAGEGSTGRRGDRRPRGDHRGGPARRPRRWGPTRPPAERAAAVEGKVKALPRGHPGPPDRDRPRGGAPVRPQGRVGRRVRRRRVAVHPPVGAGDDPAASAGAAGARHPGRRRRRAVAVRGAGVVRAAGRQARRGVADASCAPRWSRSSGCAPRARTVEPRPTGQADRSGRVAVGRDRHGDVVRDERGERQRVEDLVEAEPAR